MISLNQPKDIVEPLFSERNTLIYFLWPFLSSSSSLGDNDKNSKIEVHVPYSSATWSWVKAILGMKNRKPTEEI